ncbi:hypothetical protein EV383_4347 [Pseudonocardia sediminis]|uniref:Uncharacterized protein n=1 Tax=Pseudonocardia sediminis TaxID=1397368 RepID=A0A4Q7V1S7_PSEST|nr:hypothetical protein [Pseudonocardia sediminis]RZT87424.1 hypothetical protein EV383_4347 [Pseudonocardia sediminis]
MNGTARRLDPSDDGTVMVVGPTPSVERAVLCGQKVLEYLHWARRDFRRVCILPVDERVPVCPEHGPRTAVEMPGGAVTDSDAPTYSRKGRTVPPPVHAPFTPEQQAALNRYQLAGVMHPFTCPHCDGSPSLLAFAEWRCPWCPYTQHWAHEFMATDKAVEPSWRRSSSS